MTPRRPGHRETRLHTCCSLLRTEAFPEPSARPAEQSEPSEPSPGGLCAPGQADLGRAHLRLGSFSYKMNG